MADKKEGKEEKGGDSKYSTPGELLTEIFIILLCLLFLLRMLSTVQAGGGFSAYFHNLLFGAPSLTGEGGAVATTGGIFPAGTEGIFHSIYVAFFIMANALAGFFIACIVYASVKIYYLDIEWRKLLYPVPEELTQEQPKNSRWDQVVIHIQSDNPSDWRLAILEADIVLDEMLDRLGYVGDTIGDKLKLANPGDFRTLNAAWEAHKIRNALAHEGQDFILTQREANRVIGLYEMVFKEFDFI